MKGDFHVRFCERLKLKCFGLLDRWSNRQQFAISFCSGGRNFFEHQNKFLIFEQIMNFGCQAEVFQLPHHRQYLFVMRHPFLKHASRAGRKKRKNKTDWKKLSMDKTLEWF